MKSFTEYIQIKNVLKLEMDQRFIDSLEQWVEDNDFNYSFPALFQNDPEKTRIVLPMAQDKLGSSILNKIKSLGEINLKKGTVKKGKNDFRIGKVLLDVNSGFNEEEKRWWKTQANPIDSLDNQQEVLDGKRPRMKDFKLLGGSHQDTNAGDMFNNLFKDDLDVGGLNAEDDDDDESNLADIWQTELDDVKEKYQNQLQICSFYAEAEEYDGGELSSF